MADHPVDKKRKRQAHIADSSRKKVAFDNGRIAVRFTDEDGLHPVLASTPGLTVPSILFRPYAQSLSASASDIPTPKTHEFLLQSSKHPRLDYIGTPETHNQNLSHYVAVYDPQAGSMQVIPAHYVSVRSSLRSERQEVEQEARPSMLRLREELGREFGTKKAKKAIMDKTVNAIVKGGGAEGDSKTDKVQDAILESMDAVTAANKKKEDIERDLLAAKPIPQPNLEAESVEDVYSINTLVPRGDLRLVAIQEWQDKVAAEEKIEFNHRYPAYRVKHTALMNDNTLRLKALGYLALLLDFNSALRPAGRAGKKVPKKDILQQKLAAWPADLVDSVRRRFANPLNEFPKWHLDNLYTHMCALSLFVDGYATVITDLRDDLGLDNKQMTQYFQELGCKVVRLSDKERESMKLNKAQAAATRVAKLRLPLEFPKVRSGRRT